MKPRKYILSTAVQSAFYHMGLFFGVIMTSVGSIVISLLPPLILGKIIDSLTGGFTVSLFMILNYFTVIILCGISDSVRESLLTVFGQKITHSLRSSLSEKLTRLSASDLENQEPGTLTARFMGDVNTVEKLFTSGIISMLTDACKLLSIMVIIWIKNRGLAYLLLLFLPFAFLFTRTVQKRMLSVQIENRATIGRMTDYIPETMQCIRTIHNLQKEPYMEKRYNEYINKSYGEIEKNNFYDSVYSPVIMIFNAVVTAVVMLLAASGRPEILTLFGMTVGTSVAVINYIAQIFTPLESIGMEIQTIQSAVAGAKRINEFLNLPERGNITESAAPCISPHCVELRNVSFGYTKQQKVFDHLSFYADKGEQLTIAGKTGAGKSTVFKLLLGLYAPQEGEVLINGINACSVPDADKRKIFGYVSQTLHAVPGTIKDQITLFDPSVTDEMVISASKLTGLHEIISDMERGYDTPCTPTLFSQGQWQLLFIARAVVTDPEILLLDEITANLDADTEKAVLHALNCVSANRTVISISHRVYQHENGEIFYLN